MLWRLFCITTYDNHKFGTEINVLDSTTKKAMNKSIVIDSFIANLSIFKYTYLSCSALFAMS
ncbi:hypothetical protein C0103_07250 [Staphylococcus aureus]|nr:hypothetical protein BRL61_05435 [Staphylococcus aureus]AUU48068.1 hypothetical protein RK78_008260 [Staphylococcus aureus]AUU61354.1 hypothetical protein RK88_006135 [Staphylococcus aureus]AVS44297.1 hypothetical protein C9J86_10185 [Staphylococcus aureus]AVU13392.1 hypothetical protein AB477_05215 [Staphylococcus aureus]